MNDKFLICGRLHIITVGIRNIFTDAQITAYAVDYLNITVGFIRNDKARLFRLFVAVNHIGRFIIACTALLHLIAAFLQMLNMHTEIIFMI